MKTLQLTQHKGTHTPCTDGKMFFRVSHRQKLWVSQDKLSTTANNTIVSCFDSRNMSLHMPICKKGKWAVWTSGPFRIVILKMMSYWPGNYLPHMLLAITYHLAPPHCKENWEM